MARVNTNKIIEGLAAQRRARIAEENDVDFNFIIEVLEGRVGISDSERQRFIRLYKKALESGLYIGRKEGKMIMSSKFPEKAIKQLANFDNFINEVFIRS